MGNMYALESQVIGTRGLLLLCYTFCLLSTVLLLQISAVLNIRSYFRPHSHSAISSPCVGVRRHTLL